MADGKIVITGDAMQLIRENEKLVKSNAKVEKKYESLKDKSKGAADAAIKASRTATAASAKANKKASEGLNAGNAAAANYTRSLKGIGAGFVGFTSLAGAAMAAVKVLNDEMEKSKKLKSEALTTGQTAEAGLQQARANFVEDETVSKADFDRKVASSAAEINIPVEEFATALADTLSAKGSKSNEFAFQATQAAFQVSPNKDVDSARQTAQAAGDLAKLGESQSPEALIGALLQTQKAARLTNVSSTGKTSAQATQAAVQQGASIEEGLELFATLTSLMNDATGELSSTAAIKLVNQLSEFKPLEGIEGPLAKIQALQNDSKLAQQFLDDASFEEKAKGGITSLVTGDERGLSELNEVRSKIGSVAAADDARNAEFFRQEGAFIRGEGTVGGILKRNKARSDSTFEQSEIADTQSQIEARIRDVYNETADKVQMPGIDSLNKFNINQSLSAVSSPESALRVVENEFSRMRDSSFLGGLSQSDKAEVQKQIDGLKDIKEAIDLMRKQMNQGNAMNIRQSVENTQETTRVQRNNQPAPIAMLNKN